MFQTQNSDMLQHHPRRGHLHSTAMRVPRLLILPSLATLLANAALAVEADPVLEPPNAFLLNNNAVPIGHYGSLEAGASLARPTGTEAIWYNPALLADLPSASLSASASVYERQAYSSSVEGYESDQNIFLSIPSFVGGNIGTSSDGAPQFAFALVTPKAFNQAVNFSTNVPTETGEEGRVVINSQSKLDMFRPVVGFGYRINDEWAIGLRVDGVYGTLTGLRTIDWRFFNADGSLNTIANDVENYEATVYQIGAAASVHWRPNEEWSIGAMVVTPSTSLQDDGFVNINIFAETPDFITTAYLDSSSFAANLEDPGSIHLGIGYTEGLNWSIELAGRLYLGRESAQLVETPDSIDTTVTDKESGDTSTGSVDVGFASLSYRSVLSLAIGGRYRLKPGTTLHAGYQYDPSPVDPDSSSGYSSLDLHMLRIGISRQHEHLSTSYGLGFTYGATDQVYSADFEDGVISSTGKLQMWSVSLILGTTYNF